MYELPYGNTQQLNLDWFIKRWQEFYAQWQEAEAGIDHALDAEIQRVEDAMTDLYAARDAAAASATAAAASASSASNSATTATNAATAAAASATLANNKATAAGLSEAAAANSANSASNSATAAATSASQASASEASATASAQSATASAQSASNSAGAAATSETNAAASAEDAEESAQRAEDAAAAAQTSGVVKSVENVPIASVDDALAENVVELVVGIDPIQAGTGDPAPDNVRPITGWTSANIERTGKNIFNGLYGTTNKQPLPKNISALACSGKSTGLYQLAIRFYNADNIKTGSDIAIIAAGNTNGAITITTFLPTDATSFILFSPNSGDTTTFSEVQVEINSAATNYEPYIGVTYPITFPIEAGTVYGGTLTNDGEIWKLIVDRVLLNSSDIIANFREYVDTKNMYAAYMYTYNAVTGSNSGINTAGAVSNMFSCDLTWTQMISNNSYAGKIGVYHNSSWNYTRIYIYLPDSAITSQSDAEAWLNANNVQITYRLATPTVYTLTETQVITLLNGINNVWADTGNINLLQYYADSKEYIDTQDALVKALIAKELDDMIADTALTTNDFRIVNNTLYRITAPIASGATLTPNTNCTTTTVGEILKTLLT